VNNQGKALLVYLPNGTKVSDGFSTGVTTPVQINTLTGLPSATSTVDLVVNLDSSAVSATTTTTPFDPANPNNTSNNGRTSVTVYDSLGSPHILTTFFVKEAAPSTWSVYHYMSEPGSTAMTSVDPASGPATLLFQPDGRLDPAGTALYDLNTEGYVLTNGAAPINVTDMNFAGSTQVQQKFSVNDMKQNGLPAGRLTGIDIDDGGVIFARFSNGGSQTVGKVALTRFANNNGLAKLGDTAWGQSANSGEPIRGEAGANNFGAIQSGALEGSNVDLSAQLVNLIVAQQAYQANAQTITTENTIMQTILNIR
jgi:flagellar hook protein FlgE